MIEKKAALLVFAGALGIAGPVFGESDCKYRGTTYSHGALSCQTGSQFRCNDGQWSGLGVVCAGDRPAAPKSCEFNGNSFSPGSVSCQSGTQYRCDDGAWRSLTVACTSGAEAAPRSAPGERTCMYNDATVATQSTICKSGITFRCDDGEWRNLGTPCR